MRILTIAILAAIGLGIASSANAVVCETTCNQGYGSGSQQCYTRCHH